MRSPIRPTPTKQDIVKNLVQVKGTSNHISNTNKRNNPAKILDRQKTLSYIKEEMGKRKMSISRYQDGEYKVMTKKSKLSGSGMESSDIASDLIDAFCNSNQFMCINQIKPRNLKIRDIWFDCYNYYKDLWPHKILGNANWNVEDYKCESDVLSDFFLGRTLIVTGWADYVKEVFKKHGIEIDCISTPSVSASLELNNYRDQVNKVINQYDNVLFACGKIGKIMIAENSKSLNQSQNLIDIGAVLNAILQPYIEEDIVSRWGMSWAKNKVAPNNYCGPNLSLLSEKSNIFFEQVKRKR